MNNVKAQITDSLQRVGVVAGDTILLHSDASLIMKLSQFEWWEEVLVLFYECLETVLTDTGTLVVPTFNYDFCQGKPYDHEKTPSRLGFFTNYIRSHPRAVRSFHPILSFVSVGTKAHTLCDNVSKSSYGPNSVFDRLMLVNAKIIFFNASFESCAFVHHVEQERNVNYRYRKYFTGEVSFRDKPYLDTFDFFVRDLDRDVKTYLEPLRHQMEKENLIQCVQLSEGLILQTRCKDVYQQVSMALDKTTYFLLAHPPKPVSSRNMVKE